MIYNDYEQIYHVMVHNYYKRDDDVKTCHVYCQRSKLVTKSIIVNVSIV